MITVKQLMMIGLSALATACAPKEPVKYLALSFDDGPNLTTESKMLDVLAKHDVPATFFLIGNNINEETAENMKRALELGCEIGNHSLTHSRMSQMDEEQGYVFVTVAQLFEKLQCSPDGHTMYTVVPKSF